MLFTALLLTTMLAAQQPLAQAPLPPGQYPYSQADVDFMSGMIPHHAQAVLMAGWVAGRTERRDLRVLAERIAVAQKDEIALMQTWLSDRGLDVISNQVVHSGLLGKNGRYHTPRSVQEEAPSEASS